MSDLPSIFTVAKLAGVSIATVSRVLNQSRPVANETRLKVESAVIQLGYRPNIFGRSLRKAGSRMLLVLTPNFSDPFFGEMIQGVESVARNRNYNIVLADASDIWNDDQASLNPLYSRMTDGVICLAHIDARLERIESDHHLPWVLCSDVPGWEAPYVSIDHCQGAVDAVQYLIGQGHRRIGLISAYESSPWSQQRRAGYKLALSRAGIPIDTGMIQTVQRTSYACGSEAAGRFMMLEKPPTAIFAMSDTLAVGAIKALHRAGRRVPEDIAIIGFDNIPVSDVFEPGLTTIAQPMGELGATATELLLDCLNGAVPVSRTLPHSLIVRESA